MHDFAEVCALPFSCSHRTVTIELLILADIFHLPFCYFLVVDVPFLEFPAFDASCPMKYCGLSIYYYHHYLLLVMIIRCLFREATVWPLSNFMILRL